MKVGLHTRLKPGSEERYEEYHRNVWPEVLAANRRVGVTKYVIFRDGLDLFHYIECADFDRAIAEPGRRPGQPEVAGRDGADDGGGHDFSGKGSDRMPVIFEL